MLLVLVFLLSCRSVPQQFELESVYPSYFVTDDRNILFACENSELKIEGFWLPCVVVVLLSYSAARCNTLRRLALSSTCTAVECMMLLACLGACAIKQWTGCFERNPLLGVNILHHEITLHIPGRYKYSPFSLPCWSCRNVFLNFYCSFLAEMIKPQNWQITNAENASNRVYTYSLSALTH